MKGNMENDNPLKIVPINNVFFFPQESAKYPDGMSKMGTVIAKADWSNNICFILNANDEKNGMVTGAMSRNISQNEKDIIKKRFLFLEFNNFCN